jgi:hypothetical protein
MKRAVTWLVAIATTAGIGVAGIGLATPAGAQEAASAATPYCGIYWGSLPKTADAHGAGLLTNIRAGQHDCFDRLVFDLGGRAPGYRVRYVDEVVADGSGAPVPLRGGAFLQIIVPATIVDENGQTSYIAPNPSDAVDVTGWRTFRQVAQAGAFEGQITVGLGVRARLPYRAFTLDGPGDGSRLVVDVAHLW